MSTGKDHMAGDILPSQKRPPLKITTVQKHDAFTLLTMVPVEPKAGRPKNGANKRQEDARWRDLYAQCRADGMSKTAAIKRAAETFNVKFQTARSRYRRLLLASST